MLVNHPHFFKVRILKCGAVPINPHPLFHRPTCTAYLNAEMIIIEQVIFLVKICHLSPLLTQKGYSIN